MSFSKHLLSSIILAGTVFAATVVPLATFGPKPVAIQLEGKPVFTGQFKELSAPYLGLALALSIGAGVANLAVLRWYQSACKLSAAEAQLAAYKQQISEQDGLIENLQFSPARLQASGLERFLQTDRLSTRVQRGQVRQEEPVRLETVKISHSP